MGVLDLYSRLVVGWAMSERMTASLVCDALRMALWRPRRPQGVMVHSDRGSQNCSADHRRLNAAIEIWNHSLKVEAILWCALRHTGAGRGFSYLTLTGELIFVMD